MAKSFIPYNKKLNKNAGRLRNESTLSEVLLWNELKAGKLMGYKFNRQKPIGKFIVDFYCKKLSLVVEVDGESHIGKELSDIERTDKLEKLGVYVMRFDDLAVKKALDIVMNKLIDYIDKFEDGKLNEFIDKEY